jgi:hypothetical protein
MSLAFFPIKPSTEEREAGHFRSTLYLGRTLVAYASPSGIRRGSISLALAWINRVATQKSLDTLLPMASVTGCQSSILDHSLLVERIPNARMWDPTIADFGTATIITLTPRMV